MVSVPLRGSDRKTIASTRTKQITDWYRFQSPCGEVIVKQGLIDGFILSNATNVSVPLRGSDRETSRIKNRYKAKSFSPLAGK